jgi:hypothetical protein
MVDACRILERQLSEIAERFVDFELDAQSAGGELDGSTLLADLDNLIADEGEYVASTLALIDRREALENAHRQAAKRAMTRAAIEAKLIGYLKDVLCRYVDSRGGKVEGPGFKAWSQPSPPKVEFDSTSDPVGWPEWARTIVEREPEIVPDREAIIEAWKHGREVPKGVKVVWGRHLRRR